MTYAMEPMMPPEGEKKLEDIAFDLSTKAHALAASVHPVLGKSISPLVKSMNCYYSNLIEGHYTHPRDIDRALRSDYETQPEKRNLQQEARAHIEVQGLISGLSMDMPLISSSFISWLHREFCSRLPEELLFVYHSTTEESLRIIPGEFRKSSVQIGYHILPPKAEEISIYMRRFEEAYCPSRHNKIRQLISVAASHHRLLWIHPFYDGNGRVARLFSDTLLQSFGVRNDLWSISRGLARTVQDYKRLLAEADLPRLNDVDGRGNLSQRGLIRFCAYFLTACIDQVEFMGALLDMKNFLNRLEKICETFIIQGKLKPGSFPLLREAFFAGEIERGRAPALTGYKERHARSILSQLIKEEFLTSDRPKGSLRLNFPLKIVSDLFPSLYPA